MLKEFFLPFPRLDIRLGWAATINSLRAHHFAIIGDDVVVISGKGKKKRFTSKKNNILNDKLNQIEISNNIQNILDQNNFKLNRNQRLICRGGKDLYIFGFQKL